MRTRLALKSEIHLPLPLYGENKGMGHHAWLTSVYKEAIGLHIFQVKKPRAKNIEQSRLPIW